MREARARVSGSWGRCLIEDLDDMDDMTDRKTDLLNWAEINLGALTHNIKRLRQYLAPKTQLMAVVKKNAYGHGAVPVAKAALAAGAEWLGVHSLEEGLELRDACITAPVLILGDIPRAQAATIVEKKLTPTVIETELPLALDRAARDLNMTVAVHVKVDTGLNRFGASIEDVARLLHFIAGLGRVRIGALYTHFASADEPDRRATEAQLRRFLRPI